MDNKTKKGLRRAKIAVRLNKASKLRLNSTKNGSPKMKRRKINTSICSEDFEPWPLDQSCLTRNTAGNLSMNAATKNKTKKKGGVLNESRTQNKKSGSVLNKSGIKSTGAKTGKGFRNFFSRILK